MKRIWILIVIILILMPAGFAWANDFTEEEKRALYAYIDMARSWRRSISLVGVRLIPYSALMSRSISGCPGFNSSSTIRRLMSS